MTWNEAGLELDKNVPPRVSGAERRKGMSQSAIIWILNIPISGERFDPPRVARAGAPIVRGPWANITFWEMREMSDKGLRSDQS